MDNFFCEELEIESGKKVFGIFDKGVSNPKTVRGTQLNDTRPFILIENKLEVGDSVKRKGTEYKIAQIEENSVGFYTYFLELKHGSDNYLS